MARARLLLGTLLTLGCGSPAPPPAAGGDLAAVLDLAAPSDGPWDLGAAPDLVPQGPRRLVQGRFLVVGVTGDGHAVYHAYGTNQVSVVPLAGGAPKGVAANAVDYLVEVQGSVVLAWHDVDDSDVGSLTAWSLAGGAKRLATRSPGGLFAVAADGSWVAFYDQLTQDGQRGDLVICRPDGTGRRVLATRIPVLTALCAPQLAFVGGRLVATRCAQPGDGAPPASEVTSWDPATGDSVQLLARAESFLATSQSAQLALVKSDRFVGSVVPAKGGPAVAAGLADLAEGLFLPDGKALIATTLRQALVRFALPGGQATPLLPGGARLLFDVSPSGSHVLFAGTVSGNGFFDLRLAPTQPGTVQILAAQPSGASGGDYGASFTDDGRYVVGFREIDPATEVGTLFVAPIAGGAVRAVATKAGLVLAAGGSRVVFGDGYLPIVDEDGRADVRLVDLAQMAAPTLLVPRANATFALSGDRRWLVYGIATEPSQNGLWVLPLPTH